MARFIPNPGFASEFARSLEAKKLGSEVAEEIAGEAREIAPVETGAYQASIHVEGTQVVADVDYAIYVEVGTVDTPRFRVLGNAVERAGYRLGAR